MLCSDELCFRCPLAGICGEDSEDNLVNKIAYEKKGTDISPLPYTITLI